MFSIPINIALFFKKKNGRLFFSFNSYDYLIITWYTSDMLHYKLSFNY